MDFTKYFSTRQTAQSQPIPGREAAMDENSAGGYAFPVDDWTRLERFLVLGSEGGSYYATEQVLTVENAQAVKRCVEADDQRVVRTVVEISDAGRAPKNDPALFALAMCAGLGDDAGKEAALAALPKVARIGTHLFHFARYVEAFRGWGRGLRRAVANWYAAKEASDLAFQAAKYQQRDGWSHRDLLRLAHPKPPTPQHDALFRWITQNERDGEHVPALVNAVEEAKSADKPRLLALIREHRLSREMIPTEHLSDPEVWEALVPHLGLTALYRNLGNLSKVGYLKQGAHSVVQSICERLTDAQALHKARVHPIQVLMALRTYGAGRGARGRGQWDVVPDVVDALDEAFYKAFDNVEPTGKRWVIGLDVSGSMTCGEVAGVPGLTPRVAAGAMAMVTYRVEPKVALMAFCDEFVPLRISRRERLDDVCRRTAEMPFGGTDCSLPMVWAMTNHIEADVFMVLTDSETWAGEVHPCQALQQYRQKTGIAAQLVVVGMVSNGFTIADPDDAGMLDVVGFDTATPTVIADFARRGSRNE